jgi:hypothetical protein
MSVEHNVVAVNLIHALPGLGPYSNLAARLAATVASTDIGKSAIETDTGAQWVLRNNSPLRWDKLCGPTPINPQTGTSYTLVLSDADSKVILTNAAAIALTIPLNASVNFTPGDSIRIKQGGAGAVTVAGASGVTVHPAGTLVTGGLYSELVLECEAADVWAVFGKST